MSEWLIKNKNKNPIVELILGLGEELPIIRLIIFYGKAAPVHAHAIASR